MPVAARCVLPCIALTVEDGDLIYPAYHTRHDDPKVCSTEVVLHDSMAGISKVQLSTHHHGILYPPAISANCSPSTIVKHFNSALVAICTTAETNLWKSSLEGRISLKFD